jgi:hypothetical protein
MAESTIVRTEAAPTSGGGIMRRLNMWTGLAVGVVLAAVAYFVGNLVWGGNDQGEDQAVIAAELGWVLGFLIGVGAFVAPVN